MTSQLSSAKTCRPQMAHQRDPFQKREVLPLILGFIPKHKNCLKSSIGKFLASNHESSLPWLCPYG